MSFQSHNNFNRNQSHNNFNRNQSNQSFDDYKEYKEYIINENHQQKKTISQLQSQNKKLESQVSSLEEDNDKYDERIRYLKGLLKNLHAIKTDSLKVKDCQNEILSKYKNTNTQIQKNNKNNKNFFLNYLFGVAIIIVADVIISPFIFNYSVISYIKTILFLIIPFIICSFIFGYLNNNNISMFTPFIYTTHIKNKLDTFHLFEQTTQSKINELLQEIKTTEDACSGIDVMIDNI